MAKPEENMIHHVSESIIGLQGSVGELQKQSAKQSRDISDIKEQGTKIYEAVAGNKPLGHVGLAQRVNELEDHHVTLKEAFEDYKKNSHKKVGIITGFFFGLGFIIKFAFLKLLALFG